MRRTLILTVSILAVMAIAAPLSLAGISHRYDEKNTGVSAAPVAFPLSLAWKYSTGDTDDPLLAAPAVGEDMAYFCAGKKVYGCDLLTGAEVWNLDTGAELFAAPVLYEGNLYVGAGNNQLIVIDASSGNRKAAFRTTGAVKSSPMIHGGIAYFGCDDKKLYAVNLGTMALETGWPFQSEGEIIGTPAMELGMIYFAATDGYLYCVDTSAKQRWRSTVKHEAAFSSPAVERGKVIAAAGAQVIAFDAERGAARWSFSAGDLVTGSPATHERLVYIGSKDGSVYCLDANTGKALWRYPKTETSSDPVLSAPTIVNGDTIVVRMGKTKVVALTLRGEPKWQYKLATPPEKEKTGTAGPGGTAGAMMPGMAGMMPGMAGGEMGDVGAREMAGAGMTAGGEGGGTGGRRGGVGGRRGGIGGRRGGIGGGGAIGGAGGIGGGQTTEEVEIEFDENAAASLVASENGVYAVGDDGALYAFQSGAADNVPPKVSDPQLDIKGKDDAWFSYGLHVATSDEPENFWVDDASVPGSPPLQLSMLLLDEGSGVDPSTIEVTMDGAKVEHIYDVSHGELWYIYQPRGGGANMPNGLHNFVIKSSDYRGCTSSWQVSFEVDNNLPPPEAQGTAGGMMGPGMEGGMMGPGMGGGMMGPGGGSGMMPGMMMGPQGGGGQ